MKPLNKTGFTIVETMLFLGISGLLVMGVLVGTGTAINIQRYRDSVASFRSFLQQQYSDVANVSNNVDNSNCDSNPKQRGQSDCVILGRLITNTDKDTLLSRIVTGNPPPVSATTATATDDIEALKTYTYGISNDHEDTYDMDWGSSIANIDGSTLNFSMLILRSPTSGIIRTFIDPKTKILDNDIASLLDMTPSALTQSVQACVNSNGALTGNKMAVLINANATSASSIESLGEQDQSNKGGAFVCQ